MYSSSDQSTVIVKPGQSFVAQTFRYNSEYQKVKRIALEILTSPPINTICADGEIYSYDLKMFHSQIQKHDDRTRTIHWARIVCLNQLDSNAALTYIRRNWLKFFWDIFRGIFGFYVCGFHHGDVSLDNIGIRDGSFVLYDYNLSRANRYASDDLYRDIYTLFRSLHWRIAREVLCHKEKCLIDTLQYIHTLEEYIEYVREEQNFRTNSEALLFLDALTIQPYTQANQRDSDDNYPEP